MAEMEPGWCALRALESAPMPAIVWHIAVAALLGNAYAPEYDAASSRVRSGAVWRGPMGRPPVPR